MNSKEETKNTLISNPEYFIGCSIVNDTYTAIEEIIDEHKKLTRQFELSEQKRLKAIEKLYIWGETSAMIAPEFQKAMLEILEGDE